MTRHLVSLAVTLTFGLGAASCANATDPATLTRNEIDGSAYSISVAKGTYDWEEASHEGVRGTIRNVTDRELYSNLGDAMVIGAEQQMLYVANFSDGVVERRTSATSWTRVPSLTMVEGTRFVVLRPGQSYTFIAPVAGTPQSGTFRIGISFRSTINDEEPAETGTSYSPAFTIR